MILTIEILLIIILFAVIVSLYIAERQRRKKTQHIVALNEFWDGTERRTVERHDINLDVDYNINSKPYPSKSRDISANGIGLLLPEKLEKGTPIRMEIKLPIIKPPIEVRGEVIWAVEVKARPENGKRIFSTGIKFVHIAPRSQKILFEYIKNLEKGLKTADEQDPDS